MSTVLLDLISFTQFANPTLITAELDAWFDSQNESDYVLAFLLYEFLPRDPITITCLCYLRDRKIKVLLDHQYHPLEHQWRGLDIVYIHYWPLYVKTLSDVPKLKWNSASDKALMLTGKMHYLNRVGALASAYKSKSLENIVFSFMYANSKFTKDCRSIIKQWDVDPADLMTYCLEHKKSVDLEAVEGIPTTRDGSKDFEFFAEIVDPGAYEQTKLSIVSESYAVTPGYGSVSEKVWKAIMCNHPYVLMALPGTTRYLTSIGVKNIDHLLPHVIENDMQSAKDVDLAIANAMWFVNNTYYHDEVLQIVEHNYQLYESLSAGALAEVMQLSVQFNVPTLLNDLMNRKTEKTLQLRKELVTRDLAKSKEIKIKEWEEFYHQMRGDSWPTEAPNIDDIPDYIKKELDLNYARFAVQLHPMSETFLE